MVTILLIFLVPFHDQIFPLRLLLDILLPEKTTDVQRTYREKPAPVLKKSLSAFLEYNLLLYLCQRLAGIFSLFFRGKEGMAALFLLPFFFFSGFSS